MKNDMPMGQIKKGRLLFICAKKPFPVQDGGAIRTMQMYRMLSQYFDIDMVYSCDSKDGASEIPEKKYGITSCKGFYLSKKKSIFQAGMALFGSKPLQCAYFYNTAMQKYIKDNICNYDYIFCNNIRTSIYISKECKPKKYIDFVDAISMNYKGAASKRGFPINALYRLESRRLLKQELYLIDVFDKQFIISDIDADYIRKHARETSCDIAVVPNSVEIPEETFSGTDENNIVFVGSMFYEPNIVAVTIFAKYIFPLIVKEKRDAKFYIVGNRPAEAVRKLASENIIVTGFVEDPKLYLRKANVVIAPMYSGAGVQNKILEAMSLGCCVVTTNIGAEGLNNIKNGEEIFIESDYHKMASVISILMADRALRRKIGLAAKKYVTNNLSYDMVFDRFSKEIM